MIPLVRESAPFYKRSSHVSPSSAARRSAPGSLAASFHRWSRIESCKRRLVDEVLDVSRAISGKIHLNVRPVELSAVVKAAVEALEPLAGGRGVRINASLDSAGTVVVIGDPDRLRQVIWNVVSNAVKFTPMGGNVDVSLLSTDAQATIEITDSGDGIDPTLLPYVFERRGDWDGTIGRRKGGLGLGLK